MTSDDLLKEWLARRVPCAAGCGDWALRGNSVIEICSFCRQQIGGRCSTLAHNLAIAAGLCRAFELGLKINGHGWWFPGSGREAPILIGQVDASPVLCEICGAASRADRPCEGCGAP